MATRLTVTRPRWILWLVLVLSSMVAFVVHQVVLSHHSVGGLWSSARSSVIDHIGGLLEWPAGFIAPLVVAALLGAALPVVRRPLGRRGVAEDVFYVVINVVIDVGVIALFASTFIAVKAATVGDWSLKDVGASPFLLALIAIPVTDLLYYWSHRLSHRVLFLWRFHEVHHSQTQMSVFTEHRVHVVSRLVFLTIFFFPYYLVSPATLGVFAFAAGYTQLYHAPIRTNLGPLRHLLVTPQSHRIHHSIDPRHHDTNFGTVFSVWDRLFGTAWPDHTEYPEHVGLDSSIPQLDAHDSLAKLPAVYADQMLYPFRAIRHDLRARAQGNAVPASGVTLSG